MVLFDQIRQSVQENGLVASAPLPNDVVSEADTPASRCSFYRRVCAIPASVQPGTGCILVRAGTVTAVTTPAHYGQAVLAYMRTSGLKIGPVVSYPRSRLWSFLALPHLRPGSPEADGLFYYHTSVAAMGTVIGLPSPAHPARRVWVHPPVGVFRPSASVVVSCLRRIIDDGRVSAAVSLRSNSDR